MTQIVGMSITSATEVIPGSTDIWRPNSFSEWIELKRVDAILDAWTEQAKQERNLRRSTSKWIFGLIAFQVIAVFSIVACIGVGWMNLNESVLKILIGGICAEAFGLGLLVTKFLYREPLKIELAPLLKKSTSAPHSDVQKKAT
jgi:hypothetical protein